LLNLTTSTPIDLDLSLEDIYDIANAKFKLKFHDNFVCFSPERFITIKNNKIFTYPMKGTIDATILDAKQKILADTKELAEHTMVVDLLRNDLNQVAKKVQLDYFREVLKIKTHNNTLYQTSSIISGVLDTNWHFKIGDILNTLLPAGSISGTPKKMTLKIIDDIEEHNRDWFSGVFGYYDGNILDSAIMIRYIQKQNGKYIYKSGGGITYLSDDIKEYQEMINKIYI
jgi:para-aminobenzoate synthetase component 1